ncbi:MAG TPA: hypothetical protein VFA07_17105, partial [Chthonomonadaceae bacterium]|nr:hypothetical protein [Chthonomonadaceae bacterium]
MPVRLHRWYRHYGKPAGDMLSKRFLTDRRDAGFAFLAPGSGRPGTLRILRLREEPLPCRLLLFRQRGEVGQGEVRPGLSVVRQGDFLFSQQRTDPRAQLAGVRILRGSQRCRVGSWRGGKYLGLAPFPTTPPRTVLATFAAHGSPASHADRALNGR